MMYKYMTIKCLATSSLKSLIDNIRDIPRIAWKFVPIRGESFLTHA